MTRAKSGLAFLEEAVQGDPVRSEMLMCLLHTQACALPLEHISEIMRPLPVQPLSDMPRYVLGLAVIRAVATPVIDLAGLLGIPGNTMPRRFVTMSAREGAKLALAVTDVLGIQHIPVKARQAMPTIAQQTTPGAVSALSVKSPDLLLLLNSGHLLSDSDWVLLAQAVEAG